MVVFKPFVKPLQCLPLKFAPQACNGVHLMFLLSEHKFVIFNKYIYKKLKLLKRNINNNILEKKVNSNISILVIDLIIV